MKHKPIAEWKNGIIRRLAIVGVTVLAYPIYVILMGIIEMARTSVDGARDIKAAWNGK